MPPGKAAPSFGSGNMTYHGGPVQSDVHLYVVFWGTWWNYTPSAGCPASQGNGEAAETFLYNYYHGVGASGDGLSNVQTQYTDSAGHRPRYPVIPQGHVFTNWLVYCSNPPHAATQNQLAAVAVFYANYLKARGAVIDRNTQIVVVSPSGTNPGGGFVSQYCAYHSWISYGNGEISWTNQPYLSGTNCNQNFVSGGGSMQGWSIVTGHEYAESATDPQGTGWYTSNYSGEIGDKCAWTGLFTERLHTGSFVQQPEYSNKDGGCQRSDLVYVASPGSRSTRVNHSVSLQINATAPDPIKFTATGLPAGLHISSTGKITGTPTHIATYTVHVTGTEASTTVRATVTFAWKITS